MKVTEKAVAYVADLANLELTPDESEGSNRFAYAQRADLVKPGLSREIALSNAPDTDGICFKVPKVIER